MDKKALTDEQFMEKLQRYCAYQERCKWEIRRKAHTLGVDDDKRINKAIKKLEEDRFLDEKRFCQSFVNGRYKLKKWGKQRLIRELKMRQIPEELYLNLISKIGDASYHEQMVDLAKARWPKISGKTDYERKGKLWRFLYAKGYESDAIKEMIERLF